jgi:hypothetical protein
MFYLLFYNNQRKKIFKKFENQEMRKLIIDNLVFYITTDSGQRLPFISNKCLEAETFINGIVYWQEVMESMQVID